MRIEYTLHHLGTVIEEVRKLHPFLGQASGVVSRSLIDEVRKKLEECDFENLNTLAYSFNIKEILACLEILVNDEDNEIVEKAAGVINIRPRGQVILRGWFKLVNFYPHEKLEETLRELIHIKGFDVLEKSRKVSPRISNWFVSKKISEGILRDYQNDNGGMGMDGYLSSNFLNSKLGLFKGVWRLLLIKGNSKSLKKEKSKRILFEYIKAENTPYLQTFGQHYLNVLKSRSNWDDAILEFIAEKYGAPRSVDFKTKIERPFWRKVSEDAKNEFNTWYILRQIDEFFEGTRARFWKQYVEINKVEQVKRILGGEGFMLDFGLFGVVEFKQIGNAAYIYPEKEFQFYWANGEYKDLPGWFKDRNRTIRHKSFPVWDGRIIHSGDWQIHTSIKINRLLGIK